MPDITDDNGAPVARTRRWERERGFTRAAFVVVPDWERIDPWHVPDWLTDAYADALGIDGDVQAFALVT